MFMTILQLSILAGVIAGVIYGAEELAQAHQGKAYSVRFRVWRDQIVVVLGLIFATILFHAIDIHPLASRCA